MANVFFIAAPGIAQSIGRGSECDGSVTSIKKCIKDVGLTASKWVDFWVSEEGEQSAVLHYRAKKVKGSIIIQVRAMRTSTGAVKWIDPKDADEREGDIILMW